MTQYYESEVLHHLMEREGFNIPSSVPKYESEIKAYLIEQVKLAYPKLTDYEAEWLLYNYTKHLPAEFPLSSVTNVTKASFENVVPYAYKSAILTGQTLVNLLNKLTVNEEAEQTEHWHSTAYATGTVKSGKYILLYNVKETSKTIRNTPRIRLAGDNYLYHGYDDFNTTTGIKKWIFTANTDLLEFSYWVSGNTGKVVVEDFILLEYQDGMENWDIPFFEGMQSVKMPVLTTYGKNTFNIKNAGASRSGWYSIPLELSFSGEIYVKGADSLPSDFRVNIFANNTEYPLSNSEVKDGRIVSFQDVTAIDFYCPSLSIMDDLRGNLDDLIANGNIVIKLGGEPYKSNILTVNEDVELGSVGEIKDELNLLTGEITSYSYNYTITGDEIWTDWANDLGEYVTFYFHYKNSNMPNIPNEKVGKGICNKFKVVGNVYNSQQRAIGIGAEYLSLGIKFSELNITSDSTRSERINALKTWLKNNNVEIRLPYAQEVVKTVELKTVNEKGEITFFMPIEGTMNVQSSGEIIQPTFDMSVPVEATSQNLASFIDLEMEE